MNKQQERDAMEKRLEKSLGEKIGEYRRLLWDLFHVTKEDQLDALVKENEYLSSNNKKDGEIE